MFFRRASLCRRLSISFSAGLVVRAINSLRRLSGEAPGQEGADHRLSLVGVADFEETPAAEAAVIVHGRNPMGVHRLALVLRVDATITLDLDDRKKRIAGTVAVIDL